MRGGMQICKESEKSTSVCICFSGGETNYRSWNSATFIPLALNGANKNNYCLKIVLISGAAFCKTNLTQEKGLTNSC